MTHEPWQTGHEHYSHVVNRRTALKLPLYLAAAAALTNVPLASAETNRWSADRANAWYAGQGWLIGANYVTSTAVEPDRDVPGGYLRSAPHRRRASPGPANRIQHGSGVSSRSAVGYRPCRLQPQARPVRRHRGESQHQAALRPVRLVLGPPAQSGPSAGADGGRAQLRLGAEPGGSPSARSGLHPRAAELCHRRCGHVSQRSSRPRLGRVERAGQSCAGLPQCRTRGQTETGRRVPSARVPVGARRQSGAAVDQWRLAGALERPGATQHYLRPAARALGRHKLPQLRRPRRIRGPHR